MTNSNWSLGLSCLRYYKMTLGKLHFCGEEIIYGLPLGNNSQKMSKHKMQIQSTLKLTSCFHRRDIRCKYNYTRPSPLGLLLFGRLLLTISCGSQSPLRSRDHWYQPIADGLLTAPRFACAVLMGAPFGHRRFVVATGGKERTANCPRRERDRTRPKIKQ